MDMIASRLKVIMIIKILLVGVVVVVVVVIVVVVVVVIIVVVFKYTILTITEDKNQTFVVFSESCIVIVAESILWLCCYTDQ